MSQILGKNQLVEILERIRGAAFCSLITVTNPHHSGLRMTAREGGERCPWIVGSGKSAVCHLRKISRTLVCLNEHYHNGVRRQMEREGLNPDTFVPGETWYTQDRREDGTMLPFATGINNRSRYLCGRNLKIIATAIYVDIRDGERVENDEVARFLPTAETRYGKQARAGLRKKIARQVWKLDGIRAMNIGGESIEVHPPAANADNAAVHAAVVEMMAQYQNEHKDAEDELNAAEAAV